MPDSVRPCRNYVELHIILLYFPAFCDTILILINFTAENSRWNINIFAKVFPAKSPQIHPTISEFAEWKSEQAECLSALMAEENAIAMLPQPFVTTAQAQSESLRVALDLTEEWDALQADSETPSTLVTGVVVARTTFVEEHPEVVSAFLDHYQESVDYVNSNVEEAAQLVGQYEIVTAEVAQKALPECNIVFIEGAEMKEKLSGYLSVLFEQNPQSVGGALPDDAFYFSR